jgi:hypothetical protein
MALALLSGLAFGVNLAEPGGGGGPASAPGPANVRATMLVFTGVVKAYAPGKSLRVAAADGEERNFDLGGLGTTSRIEPGVAVGKGARVVETAGEDGRRSVSIAPAPAPAPVPRHVHPAHPRAGAARRGTGNASSAWQGGCS